MTTFEVATGSGCVLYSGPLTMVYAFAVKLWDVGAMVYVRRRA